MKPLYHGLSFEYRAESLPSGIDNIAALSGGEIVVITPEKEEHHKLEEITRPTFLDRRFDATGQADDDESRRLREGWQPFCELLKTIPTWW